MYRPASVTTFAILNLVFALCGVCGLLLAVVNLINPQSVTPEFDAVLQSSTYIVLSILTLLVTAAQTGLLVTSGILLLSMRDLGRRMSIWYSWLTIIWTIISTISTALIFLPVLSSLFAGSGQSDPAATAGLIGGVIGGTLGLFCTMIYPIVLLIFMTRPWMIIAFQNAELSPDFPAPPPMNPGGAFPG